MLAAGKTALFVILAATLAIQETKGPAKPPVIPPDSMPFTRVKIEAAMDLIGASGLAATEDAVWVVRSGSGTLTRISPKTHEILRTIVVGVGACGAVVSGEKHVWVPLCGESALAKIDPETNALEATIPLTFAESAGSMAFGVGSLWMLTDTNGTLARIDPANGQPVAEIYFPPSTSAIVFDSDALWATSPDQGQVTRVDPRVNLIKETVKVGKGPKRIAAGEGAIWVLNEGDGTVSRIDPKSNRVTATIDVGMPGAAGFITAGEGSVWISAKGAPLVRIDTRTNRVAQQFTGEDGGPILVAHKMLWMIGRANVVWHIDPKFVEALRPE